MAKKKRSNRSIYKDENIKKKKTSINAVVCAVRVRSKGGRREATRLLIAV